jgi:hypothetical protein
MLGYFYETRISGTCGSNVLSLIAGFIIRRTKYMLLVGPAAKEYLLVSLLLRGGIVRFHALRPLSDLS